MKKGQFLILISSMFLGIILGMQVKIKHEIFPFLTVKNIIKTQDEIKQLESEVEQNKEILKTKEEKAKKLENLYHNKEDFNEFLIEEHSYNKLSSGFEAAEGAGISIILYDNPDINIFTSNPNDDIIHDVDIWNIINDLRIAGAEAISLNDQRIVAHSSIKCGGAIVRVNGISKATPFRIEAIGNQEHLLAAINAPRTYADTLKKIFNIPIEAEMKNNVYIPAYSGIDAYQFARVVELGEQ